MSSYRMFGTRKAMNHDSEDKDRFDQNRLCCGHLLEVEVVDGEVMLRCISCKTRWGRDASGALVPRSRPRKRLDDQ